LAFRRATPASDKITAVIAIHKGRIHSGRPAMVRTRRKVVVTGKFATDFVEELHAMMKEPAALPAKQSRWEISSSRLASRQRQLTRTDIPTG